MSDGRNRRDVWVVVPVHNEAPVLPGVLAELLAVFPHVVCVDDGSTDGSGEVVRRSGAHLVTHPLNLGQGAALQTGLEYARSMPGAGILVTFDADGQHAVHDAAAMVERLRTEPLDVVLGTRFGGERPAGMPLLRAAVLRAAVRLSPRLRRLGLTDTHNGLRAFTVDVARRLDLRASRMGHASELVAQLDEQGWRIGEQPVQIAYTEYSRAKGQHLLNGVNIIVEGMARGRRA
ncbi:glycosyltransferase family 2 protein [Nocardioides sp. LS1]|uniref:glycosyltransferase family 2 protein n=1 Tax=Nocardioides sp. LS1 TaxID=1027620 RepID=UPI000F61D883|nr:glycosyltransferase family 2 protein [Nocardioides sp. LS1]